MLFSSPDYPLFLIAVFFLYALPRAGAFDPALERALRVLRIARHAAAFRVVFGRWARGAAMLLLGDLVFLLVSKDTGTLWDPLGGAAYRAVQLLGSGPAPTWPAALVGQWVAGTCVLAAAIVAGRRGAGWLSSEGGQRAVARLIVGVLVVVGATVAIASEAHRLDLVTAQIVAHGHLVVLVVLGIAIGAAYSELHRPLARVLVLFVVSSLFYHAWAAAMPGPYRYLLALLLGTIILDYYLAIWIEGTESPRRRKALVIVSLVSNLGILGFFKYTNFFTQDVLHLPVHPLHLILPAGISFHTFQSLSYTIDVYRRQLRATRSPIQFATFVLFFPQLVAGPIVRAQDLLPQLADLPTLELEKATRGLYRIVVGLFKKIALADTLALVIVDRVFEAPTRFSSLEVLAGVYGYALQIYLDFSAYSDIAIGSAALLGFDLPENFRTPYRSASLQEFWRRWHISISTWLRDYLYITLGGSRGAPWRTYLNLSLTMILGGLWHGASWAFIVWGALHGFGLAITRYFQRTRDATLTAVRSMFAWTAALAATGMSVELFAMPATAGTWTRLVLAWLTLTPLWAVVTGWLADDAPTRAPTPPPPFGAALRDGFHTDALRAAMCLFGAAFLAALEWSRHTTWMPLALATFVCALAADLVASPPRRAELIALARRGLAVILVFNYVCLAWIFFRATSFDNALAVLEQLGRGELDHANLVPIVTTALGVGFLCHFFPDGSFRWLRDRFVALPPPAQGALLAATALVLRELSHTKIVPFIYFQF
ncbi:MAG TPA: MBOAT family O-acyltransferase [Kofleriaceae bacterium]|nr:MBOAT family O-acyltransferase [Kofleriaceae bacterium]